MFLTTRRARKPVRRWFFYPWRALVVLVAGLLLVVAFSWARMLWVEDRSPRQAAPAQGRWLHAHDVELYVQEFGDPAAPPLLLTHGTGAWSGTWDQNVQAMAAAGYRVIAVDLPPFGFSTRPAGRDYSRAAQARRIIGLIDALKLGPVTLLGHSYGGGPAAEAAMLQPDRVRHLILVDAAIGLVENPAPVKSGGVVASLLGIRPLRTTFIATVGTQPLFSEFWLRKFVARKEVVTPSRTAIYREPFVLDGFTASLGDWAVQFAGESGKSLSEKPEGFRTLPMPLTLVWGREDTITPLPQAQVLQRLAAGSRLLVLPGVGHIPQIEDPALFNARMSEILRHP
jgi:pimeloyl-ACP methyl ester carboxylesterase